MHRCRAGYYGQINQVDDQVGRLLQYLKIQGLMANTLILFTSDHGEMLGDHRMFRKTFAYEGSSRIPMLVRPPVSMGLKRGITIDAPVGLQDVMPTILDAAGVPVPEGVTGRSLLSLLRDDAPAWRDVLHGEHAGQYAYEHGMHYLVDDHTKYVWYSQTGREHLFDLDADPHELCDLALQPSAGARLTPWRQRLAQQLRHRPEGFSDGHRLIPGRPHRHLVPSHRQSG
jgi:arylsulfatase A-like enzyme